MNIENYSEQKRRVKPGETISSEKYECGFCGNREFEYVGRISPNSDRHYLGCTKCDKQIRLSTNEIFDFFGFETENSVEVCFDEQNNWKIMAEENVCLIVSQQKFKQEALSSKDEETQEIPAADIQKALRESERAERIKRFHEKHFSKRYLRIKIKK